MSMWLWCVYGIYFYANTKKRSSSCWLHDCYVFFSLSRALNRCCRQLVHCSFSHFNSGKKRYRCTYVGWPLSVHEKKTREERNLSIHFFFFFFLCICVQIDDEGLHRSEWMNNRFFSKELKRKTRNHGRLIEAIHTVKTIWVSVLIKILLIFFKITMFAFVQ
jgi:hypothetical protein